MDWKIPVECKQCQRKWLLLVPKTTFRINSIAAICDCGSIIAGNFFQDLEKEIVEAKNILVNGSFIVLENLTVKQINQLPIMKTE